MIMKAPRQPASATSAASGAVPPSAPRMPTVAVTADIVPKCEGGNQSAAILRQPMNVTVAPTPTRKRPVMSPPREAASPMRSEPRPITTLPAVNTRRTPNLSIRSPAGIIKPAYA